MKKQLLLLLIFASSATQIFGGKPSKQWSYSYDEHTGNVIVKDISLGQGNLKVDLKQAGRLAMIATCCGNRTYVFN